MSIFVVAGMVETIGFGQLGAFTPLYLQRQLHVAAADVPRLTGILASLSFVIGLPLAPFWGVWADKYSRKLIIVRSAAVEALLFGAVGLSHSVWQFALARAAVGFVLGNSGVMLAAQSSVTPRNRLGLAMGLVGGGGALGIAVGPVLGGLLLGRTGFTTLFLIDAALSALSAALIVAVYHEDPWRPRSAEPVGRMVRDAARDIVLVPWVRALFAAYFVLLFSIFVLRPFVPIFIAQLYSAGTHFGTLPTAIGLIVTLGALAQGVFAAFWGRLGDAVGFYRAFIVAVAGAAIFLLLQATSASLDQLLAFAVGVGLFQAAYQALFSSILAERIPEARRTSVLNLVFIPFYFAGLIAPGIGTALYFVGLRNLFRVSAVIALAALALLVQSHRTLTRPTV